MFRQRKSMMDLKMWPDPEEDEIQRLIKKAAEFFDTPKGRAVLEANLKKTREFAERLKRESRIDPAILKEPMTI